MKPTSITNQMESVILGMMFEVHARDLLREYSVTELRTLLRKWVKSLKRKGRK
jgi:hypothetical protein